MQQGIAAEVGNEIAASVAEVVSNSDMLSSAVTENAIDSIEELEDYLGVATEAIVADTSSWTQAEWAASWTGDPATHKMVNGERVELSAEEQEQIHADWAKNRSEQTQGN